MSDEKKFKGTMLGGTPAVFPDQAQAPPADQPPPAGQPQGAPERAKFKGTMIMGASPVPPADTSGAAPATPPPAKPMVGTVRIAPENMAEVQAQIAAGIQAKKAANPQQPTLASQQHEDQAAPSPQASGAPPASAVQPSAALAPQPMPAPGGSYPPATPQPVAASQPPAGQSAPPPSMSPVAPAAPKKKSGNVLLYVAVGGGLLFLGLVCLAVIAVAGYYAYATGEPGAAVEETSEQTEAAKTEDPQPEAEEEAAGQKDADPSASASAEPAAAADEAEAETEAEADADGAEEEPNIVLNCTPACEAMDGISCDKKKVKLVKGGLRLEPGKHQCVFFEPGYSAKEVQFVVEEGKTQESTVVLQRRKSSKKEPCGTFINPCK